MKRAVIIIALSIVAYTLCAQTTPVSNYTFSQTLGDYTEITGGTIHGDNTNDDESFNAIDLGFVFNYNGTDYTQISIQTNGYIAMGATVNNNTNPISNTSGSNNVVAPFGSSLLAQTSSELSSKMEGTAPNRVFIVQWKNYKNIVDFNTINFQLKLYESSNKIEFVYGQFEYIEYNDFLCQIGLRGNSNSDYNNRDNLIYIGAAQNDNGTYYSMDNTIKGYNQYQYCRIVPGKAPVSGLTFVYEEPYGNDIGIAELAAPQNSIDAEGVQNILVNLSNYGTNQVNNAVIKWQVNDGTINTYNWSGTLAAFSSLENLDIGSFDFTGLKFYTIKIWTELPNGSSDENQNNDEINASFSLNLYCKSNIVNDEWAWFKDVIIGDMYHLQCAKTESYAVTDYSPFMKITAIQNAQLNFDCFVGSNGYVAFWCDFNDDNDFDDTDEYLGTSSYYEYTDHLTGTILIPSNAPIGDHMFRIRFVEGNTAPTASDACTPLSSFQYSGDAHDYMLTVYDPAIVPDCAVNVQPTDGSTDVYINETLEWSNSTATSYDVYFGDVANPPFIQNQVESTFNPGVLDSNSTYYWKIVAKNEFGDAVGCDIWSFTTGESIEYCTPPYSDCDFFSDYIDDFYMESIVHENTGCSGLDGYGDYTNTSYTTDLIQGQVVNWQAAYSTSDALAIWIDYNNDGVFNETNEFVYHTEVESVSEHITSGEFTIPQNAPLGIHRMRVRARYYAELHPDNGYDWDFTGEMACATIGYGETHDYNITIVDPSGLPACIYNFSPFDESIDQYLNTNLSWDASLATSFDVYFGTTSLDFIEEITTASYNPGLLQENTQYQWKIVPKNDLGEALGCPVFSFTTGSNLEYCTEGLYTGGIDIPCAVEYIDDFSIADFEHLQTGCEDGTDVSDFTSLTIDLSRGLNYVWTANTHTTAYLAIWLDVNNDGILDETECLYTSNEILMPNSTGNITIPISCSLGEHRMRVRINGVSPIGIDEACTVFDWGEAHDYTVNVTEASQIPECANATFPIDGAESIMINNGILTWNAEFASNFDVYFGTDMTPPLVSSNQTETQYDAGLLNPETTYYWKIIPSNTLGGPSDCDVWSFTTTADLAYCESLYSGDQFGDICEYGDEIDDFVLDDFEHLSTSCSTGGFGDFTNTIIDLDRGDVYNWSVTTGINDMEHVAIWIDYDNDGVFNENEEFIYSTQNRIPLFYEDTVFIDNQAPLGIHRMRVRLKSSDPVMQGTDACTLFIFGETHDYYVNIQNSLNVEPIQVNNSIKVFPNPFVDEVHIISNDLLNEITICDLSGKILIEKKVNSSEENIDLSNISDGVYFLITKSRNGKLTQKIIKSGD